MRTRYLSRRRVPLTVVEWHPSLSYALIVVDAVYVQHTGRDAVMTGAQEDAHSAGSLHYGVRWDPRARAADFDDDFEQDYRLEGEPPPKEETAGAIVAELRERLGPDFDVLYEKQHIHVEWDPDELRGHRFA